MTLGAEALSHWKLTGAQLTLLKKRENAVFRVQTEGGERYALRIHRHGYHADAALVSELRWMLPKGSWCCSGRDTAAEESWAGWPAHRPGHIPSTLVYPSPR